MDKLLKFLLVAALFNSTLWIILTPLWQFPDEQAHFAQVQNIAEIGKVPTSGFNTSREIAFSEEVMGTNRDGLGNNKYTYHPEYHNEYSSNLYGPRELEISNLPKSGRVEFIKNEATLNPPFYYLLAAGVYKLFSFGDLFTRVFVIRFFSTFFFLVTIFVIYKISQLVFEHSKILTIIITSTIAFTPMFVYVSSGLFPDPLINLLFTIVIYLSIRVIKFGVNLKEIIFLLLIFVLGFLTRQHFLIAVAIFAIAAFMKLAKKSLPPLVLATAIIYLLLPPPEIGWPDPTKIFSIDFLIYMKSFIRQTISQTMPWYWGVYKWLSLTLPNEAYQIINRIVLLSAIGLVIYFAKAIKTKFKSFENQNMLFLAIITLVYFGFFAIWDYFFQSQYHYSFGFQGRYFFPLITAHFILIFIGINELLKILPKAFSRYGLLFIFMLMLIFNLFSLTYVSASYYDTKSIKNFVIQASQYKPEIFKGQVLYAIVSVSLASSALFLVNLIRVIKKYQ